MGEIFLNASKCEEKEDNKKMMNILLFLGPLNTAAIFFYCLIIFYIFLNRHFLLSALSLKSFDILCAASLTAWYQSSWGDSFSLLTVQWDECDIDRGKKLIVYDLEHLDDFSLCISFLRNICKKDFFLAQFIKYSNKFFCISLLSFSFLKWLLKMNFPTWEFLASADEKF